MIDPAASPRAAAAIAGHRGDVDAARAALHHRDPAVRATALGALDRAGALRAEDLGTALDDPAAAVRRRALELAATRPEVPILSLLDDPDPTVVEVGAFAAGERVPSPEPGTVARLAALVTDHDDALVREAAVAALGALGDAAGLPAILTATTDKATVRRRAIIALAPFDGPEVTAALDRALTDRDWQVRQAAEDLRAAGA